MVQKFDVWAVVKDPGDAANILPIVDGLQKAGFSVQLITNGWAAINLVDRECVVAETVEVLMTEKPPRLLLTGMSSGNGGVGRDLISLLRGKSLTVIVQDIWGMQPSYAAQEYCPDYVITNDEVGKKILCEAWTELNPNHVFTTGFPALDTYALKNVEVEGTKARKALGLGDLPIVLFAGQGFQTSQALAEVVWALNELQIDCYFMPRPHPRLRMNYGIEIDPWRRALADFHGRLVIDWFGSCNSSELIAAAAQYGVVVSMYSTMLVETAALRGQAISVLYPESGMKAMSAELGFEQFPLVDLGCSAWAKDRNSLLVCLKRALTSSLDQRPAQNRHISVDGQNAYRATNAVMSLL